MVSDLVRGSSDFPRDAAKADRGKHVRAARRARCDRRIPFRQPRRHGHVSPTGALVPRASRRLELDSTGTSTCPAHGRLGITFGGAAFSEQGKGRGLPSDGRGGHHGGGHRLRTSILDPWGVARSGTSRPRGPMGRGEGGRHRGGHCAGRCREPGRARALLARGRRNRREAQTSEPSESVTPPRAKQQRGWYERPE